MKTLLAAFTAAALCAAPAWAADDALGSVGIGVRDIQRSSTFYQQALGLQVQRTFELGTINEVILGLPNGAGANVVLVHWPGDATRRYDGNDVKLVFYVADPKAALERVRAAGGKVDMEATPLPVLNGRVVALARDPDNYVVELVEREK